MQKFRIEKDSLGQKEVSSDVLWGCQTQRSLENFRIGSEKIPTDIIKSLLMIKKSAAITNQKLGVLDENIKNLIINSVDKILSDFPSYASHFPLSIWQTGSGTQSNMNVNEVVANLAIRDFGGEIGSKNPVHPNDHVNKSQSSNDTFPTAMRVSTVLRVKNYLIPTIDDFINTIEKKIVEFGGIIKIGRTHLQDATPIKLSQEFSAFKVQIENNKKRILQAIEFLYELPQGGTAVGTGLNAPKGFDAEFVKQLRLITDVEQFCSHDCKFEAIASHDSFVNLSGSLNTLAVSLMKIANDIRLLGSGPRCGLGELQLPENEPGSSIMPGKVNPTQCEALTMVCAQVMGNANAIAIGGSNGHMQLNAFKPMIIYNTLQSIELLNDSMNSFNKNCLSGIIVNNNRIDFLLHNSLMLVTSLVPKIGYDNAAKIAKNAHEKSLSLKESAMELKLLTSDEFDSWINPQSMV